MSFGVPSDEPLQRFSHPVERPLDAALVRRKLPSVLAGGWLETRLAEVALVASELIANAWYHGEAPRVFEFVLRDERATAAMFDAGSDQPSFDRLLPPTSSVSGRGLLLVQDFADDVGVNSSQQKGKWVFASWHRR